MNIYAVVPALISLAFINACAAPVAAPSSATTSGSAMPVSPTPATENTKLLQRQWMLVEFPGFTKPQLIQLKAGLNLTDPERGHAHMGCNQLSFSTNMRGDGHIEFGRVMATRMYCEGRMTLETQFAQALPAVTRYSIQGHELVLSDADGRTMRFIAQDWD